MACLLQGFQSGLVKSLAEFPSPLTETLLKLHVGFYPEATYSQHAKPLQSFMTTANFY